MQLTREIAEKAASRFLTGYNCAESVLMTMAEALGKKCEIIPKVATPFGAGIAREGSICGCISGGIMTIGLKYGRLNVSDDKEKAYKLTEQFCKEFEKRFGNKYCYELIECDFHQEEGLKKFKRLKEEKCANFVRESVKILLDLLR